MSSLLSIDEPVRAARPRPQWRAFTEMGFRPVPCRLCLGLDLGAALGPRAFALRGELNGLAWHAHEMLWGFVATIAVGFLLTAAPTGPAHCAATRWPRCAWWLARAPATVPGRPAFLLAGIADLVFFLWARRRWGARSG